MPKLCRKLGVGTSGGVSGEDGSSGASLLPSPLTPSYGATSSGADSCAYGRRSSSGNARWTASKCSGGDCVESMYVSGIAFRPIAFAKTSACSSGCGYGTTWLCSSNEYTEGTSLADLCDCGGACMSTPVWLQCGWWPQCTCSVVGGVRSRSGGGGHTSISSGRP